MHVVCANIFGANVLESSEVSKRKWKNLARLKRRKAKALAEQLMTAPVEASVPTVQPSATVLDDAEMAVVEAAISDSSANLVEGLVEGHLYQLVGGRFVIPGRLSGHQKAWRPLSKNILSL